MNHAQPSRITARIVDDPLSALPPGSVLEFGYKLFPPIPFFGLRFVENREVFDGALLGLLFRQGDEYRSLGSAAMVAPGVALVAAHVVREDLDSFLGGGCLIYGHTKSNLMLWRPYQVTFVSDESDVAILLLEARSPLPAGNQLLQFRVSTRLPSQGEPVFVCGIRPARDHFQRVEGGFEIPTGTYAATGRVTDVYPTLRDPSLMPSPCFGFECQTVGGMSGGPVFDKFGSLIGILSTGYEGQPLSYASLVGPALDVKLSPAWPPGIHQPSRALTEMHELCAVDRSY